MKQAHTAQEKRSGDFMIVLRNSVRRNDTKLTFEDFARVIFGNYWMISYGCKINVGKLVVIEYGPRTENIQLVNVWIGSQRRKQLRWYGFSFAHYSGNSIAGANCSILLICCAVNLSDNLY